MSNIILEKWEYRAERDSSSIVIPDGCRDILFWHRAGKKPKYTITSLDKTAYQVAIGSGDYLQGFRLKVGATINEEQLLASLKSLPNEQMDIIDRINNFSSINVNVEQALACLASGINRVSEAASELGVSQRTLQRLLKNKTNRTATSWLSLARVRKSAKIAPLSINLAQTAIACGYADQSHMNREFKRWLGVSPAKIHQEKQILKQLNSLGYC